MRNNRGFFITLEGCEGSGKSTQIELIKEYLKKRGVESEFTREPGGTPISEKIREVILDGSNTAMTDEAEALLYAASRIQHVKEKILPSVAEGKVVVCDRYIDSSFAYQAYARGLGYEYVEKINCEALRLCTPDMTIFFDISPDEAFSRKGGADKGDRLEESGIDFHRAVYSGYKELAKRFPKRIVVIDARRGKEEIFCEVKKNIDSLLGL